MKWKPKHEWGHPIWSYLHTITIIDGDINNIISEHNRIRPYIEKLHEIIPCKTCSEHYLVLLQKYPLDNCITEHLGLFKWTVNIHNEINRKLNRQEWTFDQALRQWGTPYERNKSINITIKNLENQDIELQKLKDDIYDSFTEKCGSIDINIISDLSIII